MASITESKNQERVTMNTTIKRGLLALLIVGALGACGAAKDATARQVETTERDVSSYQDDRATDDGEDTPTTTERPTTTTTEAEYVPTTADFVPTVTVTRKACFGSAGCNVTYKVDFAYAGQPWEPGESYDVTYTVSGSDYGDAIDTVTMNDDGTYMQREAHTSTANEGAVLTATVTAVS